MNLFNVHCLGVSRFIIILGMLTPCLVEAEFWQIKPSISLIERYNDNLYLSSDSSLSSVESLLKGSLAFSSLTEVSEVSARLHANFQSYYIDDKFSTSNDQFATFYANKKSELSQWKFNSSFRRDATTRTIEGSQVINNGVNEEIANVDEGLVSIELRRYRYHLTPGVSYQLDERSDLNVDYRLSGAFFENNKKNTGLYDYNQNALSLGYARKLSELDGVGLTFGVSRYSAPDNNNKSINSQTAIVGYWKTFSEVSGGSINAGVRHSAGTDDVSNFDQLGYLLRLSIKYRTELNQIRASISHDLQPSGSGSLYKSNRIKLKVRRMFRPRLSGIFRFSIFSNESIDSSSNRQYYLSASPRVSWQWSRWWSIGGGLEYRVRETLDSLDDADSKAIFVSVRYMKGITVE